MENLNRVNTAMYMKAVKALKEAAVRADQYPVNGPYKCFKFKEPKLRDAMYILDMTWSMEKKLPKKQQLKNAGLEMIDTYYSYNDGIDGEYGLRRKQFISKMLRRELGGK